MSAFGIIGAGISGISIGRLLCDSNRIVEVFEKNDKAGGLVRCDKVDGALYHRVGGHVFNAKSESVKSWIRELVDFDRELLFQVRNARILFGEKTVGYPIENHLYELPEGVVGEVISDLLALPEEPDRSSFGAFLRTSFGQTLVELYFEPYNSKIWNQSLDRIPIRWLEGKLPMPKRREILLDNIFRKSETKMVHSSFFYPKEGGSQFWINRIGAGVPIHRDFDVRRIERVGKELKIGGHDRSFGGLVFTGDIRRFPDIASFKDTRLEEALAQCRNLRTRGVTNVLCECDANDLSWLYLPEEKFNAHRIIYTGNFSPFNSGNRGGGRSTCVVEFEYGSRREEIECDIERLPGNLQVIDFNETQDAYIVQDADTNLRIQQVRDLLKPYNIHLAGRFAEWEYYNMDKCIERSMELARFLLGGNI